MFQKWIYSFSIWPSVDCKYTKSFRQLFELIHTRIEIILTEQEFFHFRRELNNDKLTLHEIERKLDTSTETVL